MTAHVTDHVIYTSINCWRDKEAAINVRTNRKIEASRGGKCGQQNYSAPLKGRQTLKLAFHGSFPSLNGFM